MFRERICEQERGKKLWPDDRLDPKKNSTDGMAQCVSRGGTQTGEVDTDQRRGAAVSCRRASLAVRNYLTAPWHGIRAGPL